MEAFTDPVYPIFGHTDASVPHDSFHRNHTIRIFNFDDDSDTAARAAEIDCVANQVVEGELVDFPLGEEGPRDLVIDLYQERELLLGHFFVVDSKHFFDLSVNFL